MRRSCSIATGLYGDANGDYRDNAWRFAVFSRAALEYARAKGGRPSIIHAHDWQAGLVPVYQKMLFSPDPIVGGVPVVFTIHNLAFQGLVPGRDGRRDRPRLGRAATSQAMEFWGQVSYLKAGINFSEQDHHRQPDLRQRDHSSAGAGLRLRRHPARAARADLRRHPQRHRHRALESGRGLLRAGDVHGATISSGKQAAKRALLEAAGLATRRARRWRGRSSAWCRG